MSLFYLFFIISLAKGHQVTYNLKRVVTKYQCATFGDCSFNSFREKFNILVQKDKRMAGQADK